MPTDAYRLRRSLWTYKNACDQAIYDITNPRTIYLSFDHSLIHSWLAIGPANGAYDATGKRIFDLYRDFGHLTPYRLTLSYVACIEILDQITHKIESLDQMTEQKTFRRLLRPLSADQARIQFQEIQDTIDVGTLDASRFSGFIEMLAEKSIVGSGDAMNLRPHSEAVTLEMMAKQKKNLLEAKRYTQIDPLDRAMHIELDAVHVLSIILYDRQSEDDDRVLAYSGEHGVQSTFIEMKKKLSRDPISLLLMCFAFSQTRASALKINEAMAFLRNFSNGMASAISVIDQYKGSGRCIDQFYPDDRRLLQTLQDQYITRMFYGNLGSFSDQPPRVDSLSDAITRASNSTEKMREQGQSLHKLVEQSNDDQLFGRDEDIMSDEAKRRLDEIVGALDVKLK